MQASCWPIINLPALAKPPSFSFLTENLNARTVCLSQLWCAIAWHIMEFAFIGGKKKKKIVRLLLWLDRDLLFLQQSGITFDVIVLWKFDAVYYILKSLYAPAWYFIIRFLSSVLPLFPPTKVTLLLGTIAMGIHVTCMYILKLNSCVTYTFSPPHKNIWV